MTSGNSNSEGGPLFGGRTVMAVVRRLGTALKTRWWIPLVTASLATVATAFYQAQLPPPSYTSVSKMWVSGKVRLPDGGAFVEEAASFYGTQAELMQSKTIITRAHARVQAQHPDLKPIPVNVVVGRSPAAAIMMLRAIGPDQNYPRLFLEAVMEEFLQFKREVRSDSSDTTLASVTQQLYKASEDLKAGQARLDEFQKDNNLIVLQEQANAATYYLTRLNRQLADKDIDLQLLNNIIELDEMPDEKRIQVNTGEDAGQVRSIVDLNQPRTEDYKTAVQTIQRLKIEREELSQFLRSRHPKMVKMDEDLSRLEKLVSAYKQDSRDQLIARREGMKVEMDNLRLNLEKAKGAVLETSKKMLEADKLKQAIASDQRLFDHLSSIVRSVDVSFGLDQENLAILEHASPTFAPPLLKAPIVIASGLVGAVMGVGIVLLLVWFDDRLGSLSELRANVDYLVVGQVPELETKKNQTRIEMLEPDDDRHHFAESYRNIRSSLLFMASDGVRPKTILITSSVPSEGKSTVSSNLARAMSFAGSKVLLIEGDLRRGMLHEMFNIPVEPGLSEVLAGKVPLSEVIRPTNLQNLSFISRGRSPRNPGELFLGAHMDRLLQDVYNQFDYVLIDTAPVLAADDTTSLAPKVDGVLFVVRNSYTSVRLLRQSLDLLQQRQVRILGLVYNRADTKASEYNYYNYPAYYLPAPAESAVAKPEKAGKA